MRVRGKEGRRGPYELITIKIGAEYNRGFARHQIKCIYKKEEAIVEGYCITEDLVLSQ